MGSEQTLAEVFEDIFIRLSKKQAHKGVATEFNSSTEIILKETQNNGKYIIDNN